MVTKVYLFFSPRGTSPYKKQQISNNTSICLDKQTCIFYILYLGALLALRSSSVELSLYNCIYVSEWCLII